LLHSSFLFTVFRQTSVAYKFGTVCQKGQLGCPFKNERRERDFFFRFSPSFCCRVRDFIFKKLRKGMLRRNAKDMEFTILEKGDTFQFTSAQKYVVIKSRGESFCAKPRD
jgi:hypothetical protein